MNAIIQTRELSRRFGRTEAFRSLSLDVPRGSIFALMGPNGAGKTTTIKMLLNMIRPTGGRATVLGTESTRLGPSEFTRIGYVSENQEMPDWMSVQDLIDFCRPMYPSWDQDLCRQLTRQFDLPLSQKIKSFSRGMRIKAALLVSLAYRPETGCPGRAVQRTRRPCEGRVHARPTGTQRSDRVDRVGLIS